MRYGIKHYLALRLILLRHRLFMVIYNLVEKLLPKREFKEEIKIDY